MFEKKCDWCGTIVVNPTRPSDMVEVTTRFWNSPSIEWICPLCYLDLVRFIMGKQNKQREQERTKL